MGSQTVLAVVPERTALMGEDGSHDKDTYNSDNVVYPKYENSGKMLTCLCPPDADLPNLNLKDFR